MEDGGRNRRLTATFQLALDHTVAACSAEAMTAAYPTLAPELVATAHRQLDRFLLASPANEFQLICEQRGLAGKLDALDALLPGRHAAVADLRTSTASTTAPEELVRARVLPAKVAEAERLRAVAEALELRNAAFARDVAGLRQQFASRLAAVGTATTQLDGLLKAAEGLKTDTVWSIVQTVDGSAAGSEANLPRKRASSEAGGLSGRGVSSAGTDPSVASTAFVVPGLAKQRRAVD